MAGDERNFCHKCNKEYWVESGKEYARRKPGKDVGASISRSWQDKDVRAARSARHGVVVTKPDGDVVELETQGLGRLTFNVRDELKRTWSRETRLDRQTKGQEGPTHQLTGKYAKVD